MRVRHATLQRSLATQTRALRSTSLPTITFTLYFSSYPTHSTGVFLESTTNFTVDATRVSAREADAPAAVVKAFVTIPDGQRMEAIVTDNQDGTYKCEYAPFKEG